jgi:RHH-type rel operon transcriptional repressor/antitoxin RelB
MLAIRLTKEMEARIARLSKRTGRTKTFYARQALEEHIGDLEDIYIAEARLEDIAAGRSRLLTLDEAFGHLK